MKKQQLFALAALTTMALASSVAAEDMPSAKNQSTYEATDNGGYEKTDQTSQTDSNGTTVTHTATKKVDVDNQGNAKTTVNIKDKKNPKGIFNKSSTIETKNTSTSKDGKVETSHETKVNGDTVQKSNDMSKQ